MKTLATVVTFAVLLAPSAACAAPFKTTPPSAATPADARAAAVKALPKGATFESDGRQFQLLGGATAVARQGKEAAAAVAARAGTGAVIEDKGPFVVVGDLAAPAAARAPASPAAVPVAVNLRTGGLALVPGIVNAKLKPGADAAAVAAATGLTLQSVAAGMGLAFYAVPAGRDLAAAAAAVAAAPGVASAELDVVEHLNVPQ